MKTTLAAILAMLVAGLIGCAKHERDERAMYGDDSVPQTRGGLRDDATRLQEDPVCGRTVNPWESETAVYDGQTFYFHDKECARRFKENPKAFLPGGEHGRMAKDPVCGMEVNPMSAPYTEEYDHKKYYFDTKECAQKFKDNPHAYMPGGDDRPGFREVR